MQEGVEHFTPIMIIKQVNFVVYYVMLVIWLLV